MPNIAISYYQHLHNKKISLFNLYRDKSYLVDTVIVRHKNFKLERKDNLQNKVKSWGYRLIIDNEQATGSSIGEDEIRIFLDIPLIINAKYSYTIGVAFGLSLFTFALTKPDSIVYGIDNYSTRPGEKTEFAKHLTQRIISKHFDNVHLYFGKSPDDTAACLASIPQDSKLSLVFIDGFHSDAAAKADYQGVYPYLSKDTVVLWHNTYRYNSSFINCFSPEFFDTRYILHTYGELGVYFNQKEHPILESYFRDNCFIKEG